MNAPTTTPANVKSVWTSEDESKFLEMTARRKRIMEENRGPIVNIAGLLYDAGNRKSGREPVIEAIADELIANGDYVIKSLKPFILAS